MPGGCGYTHSSGKKCVGGSIRGVGLPGHRCPGCKGLGPPKTVDPPQQPTMFAGGNVRPKPKKGRPLPPDFLRSLDDLTRLLP